MNKKIAVCGSIAYDHVMNYMGKFEESLNGLDLSKLSVSFLAMNRDVYFGGCAGNISFNLSLLGLEPVMLGVVGKDFGDYEEWLRSHNVNCEYLQREAEQLTASGFILTDEVENQVTIFAPEAMAAYDGASYLDRLVKDAVVSVAIVSPDFPARMNKNIEDCKRHGIAYVFDPGQNLNLLEVEELKNAIDGAKVVIANDYEMDLLRSKTGLSDEEMMKMAEYVIETKGADGADVSHNGDCQRVEAVKPEHVVDPTGCGDAFRAGILKALHDEDDLLHGCRLGAMIATYNIERKGTQNHSFDLNEAARRMMND